MYTVLQYVTLR